MLSSNQIEKLIEPIILRQERINRKILVMIAQRIKEIGEITPSDVQSLVRMLKTGGDVLAINEELARMASLTVTDVKELIRNVATSVYFDAKPFYDYRYQSFIPFEENTQLQNVVRSISNVTEGTFRNLSNTYATGFLIRDYKNPTKLRWTPLSYTYESIIDEAAQAAQSGVVDYYTAMRRTIAQLANSGVRRIDYAPVSGKPYTRRLDSAVRMNVLDAIRAINQGVEDEIGKQIGADGVEISVHAAPAPDHAPIQGLRFTNEQYKLLQSQDESNVAVSYDDKIKIRAPHRCIGIWNCHHIARSTILNLFNPTYTKEQLQQIIKDNEKGVTIGGKKYTMYEAEQKQRELETLVRYAKDGQVTALEAGDMKLVQQYQNKVQRYTNNYNEFSQKASLRTDYKRLFVDGYKPLKF